MILSLVAQNDQAYSKCSLMQVQLATRTKKEITKVATGYHGSPLLAWLITC